MRVITHVARASQALGFPLLLVGAMARVILLENVHGHNPGRATYDVDFAFAVDDWKQFGELKAHLLANSNCTADSKKTQRLYMKLDGLEQSYKVDLIPFGGIEHAPSQIAWPPDQSFVMNVAGYQDALSAAVQVEIAEGMIINVASLPGIATLKLFAWADRRHESDKDALDLATLLRDYHVSGNEDRVHEDLPALEKADYDIELVGAWLLGSDATQMASPETVASLSELLNGELKARLIEDMAKAFRAKDEPLEYAARLLEQFIAGLGSSGY
ncbi:MAG TPA: nucleotidyl transferase AbiEii/AbiGii toxin family protein [Gallionellaceae bacterium]